LQILDAAHISTLNCDEMAGLSPAISSQFKDILPIKFSAFNIDFSSSSPTP